MTKRYRYLIRYGAPAVTLLSQDDMVSRIEAARMEDAPACCPTCGSSAAPLRRCVGPCGEALPLTAFSRNRSKPLGRGYLCRTCDSQRVSREKKRRQFRRMLGRAS